MKSYARRVELMADLALGILGSLVALVGVSVYSALRLGKRTDEMVAIMEKDDDFEAPLMVSFPESVFKKKVREEATTKKN